ncbi:MAG: CAAX prenyl protease-related protein [Verrucomicrobiota bacterium]
MALATRLQALQRNVTWAHVVPLFLFLVLLVPLEWIKLDHPDEPWWRRFPEHWLYPVQSLLCFGLVLFWSGRYQMRPWRGFGVATLTAVLGIVIWVLPCELFTRQGWGGEETWLYWLGFRERLEGFDPYEVTWSGLTIALRFFRMVVVVALIEEIFWRGFLMRFLIAPDKPFTEVPFGSYHPLSFGLTVGLFALAHSPPDYFGALGYGTLACLTCYWTKSLAACIWMHAVANLALGLYVMQTGHYGFW